MGTMKSNIAAWWKAEVTPTVPISTRSLLLRGVLYGGLAAFVVVGIVGVLTFIDGLITWPRGFFSHLSSAMGIAFWGGALASIPGAVGGVILAVIVRLLRRWPRLSAAAAILVGALLAGLAGCIVMLLAFALSPEAELSAGAWAMYVGLPASGGAALGWLLARCGGPCRSR